MNALGFGAGCNSAPDKLEIEVPADVVVETTFNPLWITAGIAVAASLVWFGKWIGSVNTDRTSFKEFMEEIRADIKAIFSRLPPTTVSRQSPLRLTDLGKAISEKLNAKNWARQAAPALVKDMKGKTAYEIQEHCFKYAENHKFEDSPDMARAILDCAFEHGLKDSQVRDVLGVELRDMVFGCMGQKLPD